MLIETFSFESAETSAKCFLSLGSNAKCNTQNYQSGSSINEVFLIEVPEEKATRLIAEFKSDENVLGESRFDIDPFFDHPGNSHTMASDIMNSNQ